MSYYASLCRAPQGTTWIPVAPRGWIVVLQGMSIMTSIATDRRGGAPRLRNVATQSAAVVLHSRSR